MIDTKAVVGEIDALHASHARLTDALRTMEPADPRTPTELPNWSIGHVMTHIARNADSTIRMLAGLPQYWKGVESRASDIELGAGRTWDELVDDVVATNDAVDRRMREVTDWTGSVRATTAVRPKALWPTVSRKRARSCHSPREC